jgi:WD40 repeat protein
MTLAVSPDGSQIAAGTTDGRGGYKVGVWDVATWKETVSAEWVSYAFSPDGTLIAGTDRAKENVLLWDAHTLRPVARGQGHTGMIFSVAFARDGRRLASTSADRTVRVWDVATGQCLRVLEGHTDDVFTAAFHPGGTRLATAGRDRAVWLWDLERGQVVARLPGHTSYIWSLAFSPDGSTLASASGDFTVRLWDTAPLRTRYLARREAAALRPEADRLVESLWRQKNDPTAVAQSLRADRALSEPLRQAALRAVLRRARPAEAAPAQPPDPP